MKVYILFYEERSGYDDRREGVHAVFLDENKAKECAEKLEVDDWFYSYEVHAFDVEDA